MKTRSRGQVLVEFALISPVLISLLLGGIQFGYAFYTYNNLEKAVRDGARFASMRTYQVGDGSFISDVRNVVVFGKPNPTLGEQANPQVHGLTVGHVAVTPPSGTMSTVRISVSSYTMSLPLGDITLTSKPNATFRYVGRYVPSL